MATSEAVSDKHRDEIAAAIAGALLALYLRRAATVARNLAQGRLNPAVTVRSKVNTFAQQRAELIQQGINERMAQAQDDVPADATPQQRQDARKSALAEIAAYNRKVLIPFLAAWALHQALSDTYEETPAPNGGTMKAAVLWQWTRNTDAEPDECAAAEAASPAPYDELIGIAGDAPPVHANCQCDLEPV